MAFFIMNQRAQANIEAAATQIFGLPVTIGDINLSYVSHTIKIRNLTIANPAAFAPPEFLTVDEIRLTAANLSERPLPIKKIEVRGARFHITENPETGDTNMQVVMDHLYQANGTEEPFYFELAPASLHLKNLSLSPDIAHYPKLQNSYQLEEYQPLAADEETTEMSGREMMQTVFDTLSKDVNKTMLTAQVNADVTKAIDSGLQLIDNLLNRKK